MPEAVKEMLRLEPDVVAMDLMMPVKDGITATREILAARPETKIASWAESEKKSA